MTLVFLLTAALFAGLMAAESTVILSGRAVDVTTNIGIAGASVEITDDRKGVTVKKMQTADDGSFRTDLPVATHFGLSIQAEGYSSVAPVTQFFTGPDSGNLVVPANHLDGVRGVSAGCGLESSPIETRMVGATGSKTDCSDAARVAGDAAASTWRTPSMAKRFQSAAAASSLGWKKRTIP